jgi:MoaA/NifB/PqqE/SkfB family radical SAM enzyme
MNDKSENGKCYELILNYNCNARCSFCSQGSFDKSLNAGFSGIAGNIYAAYKGGYRRLGFTGGEPLIRPDILKIIRLGRSVGFRFIRVQTNGIALSDPDLCADLAGAGLTFCKFSFTGDDEALHDRLTGVPGSWRKALAGAESMRRLKIRIGTNILVNRRNYRRLPDIIRFFLDKGITNFVVIYPVYIGSMAANAKELGVSLRDVSKYLALAAEVMEEAGLSGEMLFLNAPPCFLGRHAGLAIGLDLFNTVVTDPGGKKTDLDASSNASKVRAPACAGCSLKGRCGGVDANYARLWGFSGFRPVPGGAIPAKKTASAGKIFFSDNERCVAEILKLKKEASTSEILALSRKIALCRDCSDGNSVLNSARELVKKGVAAGRFDKGRFYWRLKRALPG